MARILVVDDDVLILAALSRILQAEGYEVVMHSDPVVASREQGFDVVLTDFMMPYLNGIELLSALREKNPRAVRLMLTAAADFKIASEAVNRGEVFRLLGKPWALSELTSSIRQAFEHHRLVAANERLTREVADKNAELLAINMDLERRVVERTTGLLDGLISALDYRDTETQWHSRRVSLYARRLAQEIGLSGPALDVVEQGALLHDIGKIGVRDSILLKPGPLTPDEWVEMKQHPEFGYRMMAKMPYLHEAALIVLQHQERWDGKGYPLGLKGEEIVVGARIFCLVDTLDAITSDRPYRKGRPMSVARDEVRRCAGTQFDPALAEAFLGLPETEWARIRREVELMEEAESHRWTGGKLNAKGEPMPARAAGA
ncbi:HD domain-containing protein [Corallococcus exercitus]|uniref:HD domain-containing phosphohydrolase n=1 Tax=Corallococcus exercitus TaxID=2316736 RepID=UPI000EA1B875|nr:HD domain-containing phosphohydrolase [Corallococcus exercitus]RKG65556.1 HD domain-containing protein [Corallococcus exercitus]